MILPRWIILVHCPLRIFDIKIIFRIEILQWYYIYIKIIRHCVLYFCTILVQSKTNSPYVSLSPRDCPGYVRCGNVMPSELAVKKILPTISVTGKECTHGDAVKFARFQWNNKCMKCEFYYCLYIYIKKKYIILDNFDSEILPGVTRLFYRLISKPRSSYTYIKKRTDFIV